MLRRMKTFEGPRIVERSSLPPELRNHKSLLTFATSMMYREDIDDARKRKVDPNQPHQETNHKINNLENSIQLDGDNFLDDYDGALGNGEGASLSKRQRNKKKRSQPGGNQNTIGDQAERFVIGSPDEDGEGGVGQAQSHRVDRGMEPPGNPAKVNQSEALPARGEEFSGFVDNNDDFFKDAHEDAAEAKNLEEIEAKNLEEIEAKALDSLADAEADQELEDGGLEAAGEGDEAEGGDEGHGEGHDFFKEVVGPNVNATKVNTENFDLI